MKEQKRKRVPTNDKKLNLNMKTIRVLNEKELRGVAGGIQAGEGGGSPPPPTSPAAGSGGCGG